VNKNDLISGLEIANSAFRDEIKRLRKVSKAKQRHIRGLERRNDQLADILKWRVATIEQAKAIIMLGEQPILEESERAKQAKSGGVPILSGEATQY